MHTPILALKLGGTGQEKGEKWFRKGNTLEASETQKSGKERVHTPILALKLGGKRQRLRGRLRGSRKWTGEGGGGET